MRPVVAVMSQPLRGRNNKRSFLAATGPPITTLAKPLIWTADLDTIIAAVSARIKR